MTTPSRTRAFAIVAFAFVVAMAGTTLPTPLYPIYEEQFGFSGVTVTVIFATYAVGVIAALVLFGNLSDRIGRKRVLAAGPAGGRAQRRVLPVGRRASAAPGGAVPVRAQRGHLHRHRHGDPG